MHKSFLFVLFLTPLSPAACSGGGHAAGHNHGSPMAAAETPAPPTFTIANFDREPRKPGEKAFCPVMNHEFTVAANSPRSTYKGLHVVFCCQGCKTAFDADPEKYYSQFLKK